MNFMDYSDDDVLCMFTKAQVLRMHATLLGARKELGHRRDFAADVKTRPPAAER